MLMATGGSGCEVLVNTGRRSMNQRVKTSNCFVLPPWYHCSLIHYRLFFIRGPELVSHILWLPYVSVNSWWKTSLMCQFYVTITVAALYSRDIFMCVAVAVLVTAKYSRNLTCSECGWDGIQDCDPETVVQRRNSWTSPKSIGEGASGLLGWRPGSLENVSRSRTVQVWGCSRARDIFETHGPSPQKTTCSFSYRFRGSSGITALYQGLRVANLRIRNG